MVEDMALENNYIPLDQFMRENGTMINNMDMEEWFYQMVICILSI